MSGSRLENSLLEELKERMKDRSLARMKVWLMELLSEQRMVCRLDYMSGSMEQRMEEQKARKVLL